MNFNEIAKRQKNSLNDVAILAKWVNSFDPNNVNDLFENSPSTVNKYRTANIELKEKKSPEKHEHRKKMPVVRN